MLKSSLQNQRKFRDRKFLSKQRRASVTTCLQHKSVACSVNVQYHLNASEHAPQTKTINERFIKAAADQRLINAALHPARPEPLHSPIIRSSNFFFPNTATFPNFVEGRRFRVFPQGVAQNKPGSATKALIGHRGPRMAPKTSFWAASGLTAWRGDAWGAIKAEYNSWDIQHRFTHNAMEANWQPFFFGPFCEWASVFTQQVEDQGTHGCTLCFALWSKQGKRCRTADSTTLESHFLSFFETIVQLNLCSASSSPTCIQCDLTVANAHLTEATIQLLLGLLGQRGAAYMWIQRSSSGQHSPPEKLFWWEGTRLWSSEWTFLWEHFKSHFCAPLWVEHNHQPQRQRPVANLHMQIHPKTKWQLSTGISCFELEHFCARFTQSEV